MPQNLTNQQLEEQMILLIEEVQLKPSDCTNHIMNPLKCKDCIYNIGICCDM